MTLRSSEEDPQPASRKHPTKYWRFPRSAGRLRSDFDIFGNRPNQQSDNSAQRSARVLTRFRLAVVLETGTPLESVRSGRSSVKE